MKIRKRITVHCVFCKARIPSAKVCSKCASTLAKDGDKLVATSATRRRLMSVIASRQGKSV